MVESKREEFRNLKQGSLSVYDYNKLFQKLARFAKQDVPDKKSMIYQFRGGLREEIQLALVLFEPLRYDEFYNMALKQAKSDPIGNEHLFSHLRLRRTTLSWLCGCTLPFHLRLLQKVSPFLQHSTQVQGL